MTRITLHIGDKVTHTTLGEGVVSIVDEEYVTIKFATDELTFRLPDAFEKGFLSSQAAIIEDVQEDDEEEVDEEDDEVYRHETHYEPVKTQNPTKNDTPSYQVSSKKNTRGLLRVAVFWLVLFIPVIAYLFWIPDEACNITGWIMIPMYFVFVLVSDWIGRKEEKKGTHNDRRIPTKEQSGLDPLTELELGLMGSEILHNAIEREKRAGEKRRYDSLYWQESARDKNPRNDF